MFPPFKSAVARAIPFDNTVAPGFTATNVQDAIYEAVQDAINNDRYPIQASLGGNANINSFLEIFPGEDSNTAPLVVPSNSSIVAVVIQATANTNGAIRIRNKTTSLTLYDALFSGTNKKVYNNLSIFGMSSGDEITFSVVTAAVNKPKIRAWFNTQP